MTASMSQRNLGSAPLVFALCSCFLPAECGLSQLRQAAAAAARPGGWGGGQDSRGVQLRHAHTDPRGRRPLLLPREKTRKTPYIPARLPILSTLSSAIPSKTTRSGPRVVFAGAGPQALAGGRRRRRRRRQVAPRLQLQSLRRIPAAAVRLTPCSGGGGAGSLTASTHESRATLVQPPPPRLSSNLSVFESVCLLLLEDSSVHRLKSRLRIGRKSPRTRTFVVHSPGSKYRLSPIMTALIISVLLSGRRSPRTRTLRPRWPRWQHSGWPPVRHCLCPACPAAFGSEALPFPCGLLDHDVDATSIDPTLVRRALPPSTALFHRPPSRGLPPPHFTAFPWPSAAFRGLPPPLLRPSAAFRRLSASCHTASCLTASLCLLSTQKPSSCRRRRDFDRVIWNFPCIGRGNPRCCRC